MNIILTHTDFDGVVCGALLSMATKINFIKFVSTRQIWYEKLQGNEIIADLPCPWKCKLWFDHHESNLNEMKTRNIDPDDIPGQFKLSSSCAQIVYDYYSPNITFPEYFKNIVEQTNIIDTMDYNSVENWMEEKPVKILGWTTQLLEDEDYKSFLHYLIKLAKAMMRFSPEEMVRKEFIKERFEKYKKYRQHSVELIKKIYYFHESDVDKSIAILDISDFNMHQRIDKNLIYRVEPDIEAVLLINSIFRNQVKTNDLKFSFGINFFRANQLSNFNLASIFEQLDIGGGHQKVAGGCLENDTKQLKLKNKDLILKEIIKLWYQQKDPSPKVTS